MTQLEEMPPEVSNRPALTEEDYQAPFRTETTSSLQLIVVLIAGIVSFIMFGVLMAIGA